MRDFYQHIMTRDREPRTRAPKQHCCARCKTPFGCGNPACACHKSTPPTGRHEERNV